MEQKIHMYDFSYIMSFKKKWMSKPGSLEEREAT